MPQIQRTVVLAAGGSVENALSGSVFEFLTEPSAITLAAVTVAGTGAALGSVTGKFSVGSRISSEAFPLKLKATGIDADQDILLSDVGDAGERQVLQLTNTDAVNAMTVQFLLTDTPL